METIEILSSIFGVIAGIILIYEGYIIDHGVGSTDHFLR